ncbi:MAG: hypothetical protein JO076_05000 [Verrucomicrobia bacterium]|nr:hypothetical protein [Verrucomicrobiota bacterium]
MPLGSNGHKVKAELRPGEKYSILRAGSVVSWSDQQSIQDPGSQWFRAIESALSQTAVAVLLVSPDLLASDFIREHELLPLLKEAEQGGVMILWVAIRESAYK